MSSKLETFKLSEWVFTLQSILKMAGGQVRKEMKDMEAEMKEKRKGETRGIHYALKRVC